MAKDSNELVVAQTGSVYIAPVGTVVPDTPATALAGDWVELGYTTTDGVSFSASVEFDDIDAWQSTTPVRRIVTGRDASVTFTLEQWNPDSFALAFGGGAWTEITAPVPPAPGVWEYTPPADTDSIAEYALAVDFVDGDEARRIHVYRGNVTDSVETTLTRTGASVLPITFSALTPDGGDTAWRLLSNAETDAVTA